MKTTKDLILQEERLNVTNAPQQQKMFIARGLVSAEFAHKNNEYYSAEDVLAELKLMLDNMKA
ncbi:hypothetical protein [Methylophilus sp. 5]|uniref:hypothetical protein n=1 Tax=Methylophilus sp. 5 TaxID=1112274 RepID=UPI0005687CEC|nr:hypothetical protein [Methylophilus sp. 5]